MDNETLNKLKKGNEKAFKALLDDEINRAYFIAAHMTQNMETAVSLLASAFSSAISDLIGTTDPAKANFRTLFAREALKLYLNPDEIERDPDYAEEPLPALSEPYQKLIPAFDSMEDLDRALFLLNTFDGMSAGDIADICGMDFDDAKMKVASLASLFAKNAKTTVKNASLSIRLTTDLKNPDSDVFSSVRVPDTVRPRLIHDYQVLIKRHADAEDDEDEETEEKAEKPAASSQSGSKTKNRKKQTKNKKKKKKRRNSWVKWVVILIIVIILAILAVIYLPQLTSDSSSRIVTYSIEEVTYDNVTSTISGSGTLTPVTRETVMAEYEAEVTELNYTVGDEVEEGEVILVLTNEDGDEEEYEAPYDCVLLELPVAEGDTLQPEEEIMMLMGQDGFTMGIAVDETDISLIELDQEAEITIDAVSGDYTGYVSAISYNGSSSGSATAYQVTVTIEYDDGIYPGMSVSAEIVVEDSGEGLMIPVDALYTSGDDYYIYLAPDDSDTDDVYDEDDLDLTELTSVEVETGMTDGSYIIIEVADDDDEDLIEEGTLVVMTTITYTETSSDTYTSSSTSFSGMSFGDFSFGGGGMDFSSFGGIG